MTRTAHWRRRRSTRRRAVRAWLTRIRGAASDRRRLAAAPGLGPRPDRARSSTTARSPAGTRPSTAPASTPSTRSSSRGHTRGPASTKPSSPAPAASRATGRRHRRRVRLPRRVHRACHRRRIVAAVERATRERLPLLVARPRAAPGCRRARRRSSRWSPVSAAVAAHKAAGLPYLVYLRHPTTGGVFASWGSLGPRHRRRAGRAHRVPRPARVRGAPRRAVPGRGPARGEPRRQGHPRRGRGARRSGRASPPRAAAAPDRRPGRAARPATPAGAPARRTTSVGVGAAHPAAGPARRPRAPRPGATTSCRCSGTGDGERDAGLFLALTWFDGTPCVLLGQDRRSQSAAALDGPGGAAGGPARHAARRRARAAAGHGHRHRRAPPCRRAAEEGGLAGEIARCLEDLVTLDAPTVCRAARPGRGGGARPAAGRPGLAAEHAWLSPLPPEGASAIVHRDTDHAAGDGRAQGVAVAGPARAASSTGWSRSDRTRPTSRRTSAVGWVRCCSTSWCACSRRTPWPDAPSGSLVTAGSAASPPWRATRDRAARSASGSPGIGQRCTMSPAGYLRSVAS